MVGAEKLTETDQMRLRVDRIEGRLLDLTDGDVADVDSTPSQSIQCAKGRLPGNQSLNDPVGIKQIHYGRSGGRDPAFRAA